jgi:hypothetical protein
MFTDWPELADHLAESSVEFAVQLEKHVRAANALAEEIPPWKVILWSACLAEFMVAELATRQLGGGRQYSGTLAEPMLKAMMAHLGRLEATYEGQSQSKGFCQVCAQFNHYCQNLPLLPMQQGEPSAVRNWAKLVAAPEGGKVSRREVERLVDLAEPLINQHQRKLRRAFYAAPTSG